MHRLLIATAAVALTASCLGPDPNLTDEGESLPILSADFPEVADAGSIQTFVLTVENPGPSEFSSVFVSFSRVGAADGETLPEPIVDVLPKGEISPVVDVRPEPVDRAQGIRFRFPPLGEGDTVEIEFDLRIPSRAGVVANSVQVYDGAKPDRIRGVLLSTRVQ